MLTKSFKIAAIKYIGKTSKSYTFCLSKRITASNFSIPSSQVLSFENISIKNETLDVEEEWIQIVVTDWVWTKLNLGLRLKNPRLNDYVIIDGETHFGINWDFVVVKRKNNKNCFLCHGELNSTNRTSDHLISKMILKAYGYTKPLPNNTVPCCKDCNKEKASMHPEVYRDFVKNKISETGEPKYRIILFTLNKIIV